MKKIIFKGCCTALVTPFTNKGVNYQVLEELINFQINNGADAIVICGTTGESPTIKFEEKRDIFKFAVDIVNKRIPVIAGTGGNCTESAIELTKLAEQMGVDAALVVTPYYNKATQNGLIKHYTQIANSTDLPIILYNVPSRTGINIEPSTCFELSKVENIVAIKEASGNLSQVAKIASLCKDDLNIYSGNDDQITPILSLGGIGVVSVLSNIVPREVHNMVENFIDDPQDSIDLQIKYIPLVNKLFSEVNPIPCKWALNEMGYSVGEPRMPLTPLGSENQLGLKKEMIKCKILKKD